MASLNPLIIISEYPLLLFAGGERSSPDRGLSWVYSSMNTRRNVDTVLSCKTPPVVKENIKNFINDAFLC